MRGVPPALEPRALRRLSLPAWRVPGALALAAAFDVATWLALERISALWATVFAFWISKLGLPGAVEQGHRDPGWLFAALPRIVLPTITPDATTWWSILAITIGALLGSRFIPERLIPARYLVRLLATLELSSVAFFWFAPAAFPYSLPRYLEGSMEMGVWFLLLVPWVHALVYYVLDFSLARKAALTVLTLGFVVVAIPLQLMAHAYVVATASMLLLAPLYFVFGAWLLIFGCVALYAWAMSWERGALARRAGATTRTDAARAAPPP